MPVINKTLFVCLCVAEGKNGGPKRGSVSVESFDYSAIWSVEEHIRKGWMELRAGRYVLTLEGLHVADRVAATMLEVSAGVMEDVVDPVGPALWVLVAAAAILTVLHVRKLAPDLVLLAVAGVLSLVALLLV